MLLYPLDSIKYFFDNFRKNIQINGSLGHEDDNKRLRNILKNFTLKNYYRGLPIRIVNSTCYTILSLIIGDINN